VLKFLVRHVSQGVNHSTLFDLTFPKHDKHIGGKNVKLLSTAIFEPFQALERAHDFTCEYRDIRPIF
jgi:hypothetical protein